MTIDGRDGAAAVCLPLPLMMRTVWCVGLAEVAPSTPSGALLVVQATRAASHQRLQPLTVRYPRLVQLLPGGSRGGVCMYVLWSSHVAEYIDQSGKVANPARGQRNKEKMIFPCPRSRVRIWSRETGSAVPSRVSLLISVLRLKSGACSRDSSRVPRRRSFTHLYRHTPSGQSRVYRITQVRTDGVHCRESAGAEPVVLKVVPVTSAAFFLVPMDQLMCTGYGTSRISRETHTSTISLK